MHLGHDIMILALTFAEEEKMHRPFMLGQSIDSETSDAGPV